MEKHPITKINELAEKRLFINKLQTKLGLVEDNKDFSRTISTTDPSHITLKSDNSIQKSNNFADYYSYIIKILLIIIIRYNKENR